MNSRRIWDDLYKTKLEWHYESKLPGILERKSVLELGFGTGKTLSSILKQKPKKIIAIDFSKETLSKLNKTIKEKATLINSNFLSFRFKEKFDVIVCYYFLNNFRREERTKVVNKIKNLLNANGIILFEDFSIHDLRNKGKTTENNTIKKDSGRICHFFSKKEISNLFSDFNIRIRENSFKPFRTSNLKRSILIGFIQLT